MSHARDTLGRVRLFPESVVGGARSTASRFSKPRLALSELLVVVGIIAILSGLLLPAMGNAKARTTVAGVPTSLPVATADTSQRLTHIISFMEEQRPTTKAKPAGVMGAEIWVKIGDTPPADPSELSFLALDTSSPYLAQYNGTHAGKKAHYMLRWVSTRGDKGPWSETISATIVG